MDIADIVVIAYIPDSTNIQAITDIKSIKTTKFIKSLKLIVNYCIQNLVFAVSYTSKVALAREPLI